MRTQRAVVLALSFTLACSGESGADAGLGPFDADGRDAGARTDAGGATVDSGGALSDAGPTSSDAGGPATDAGAPSAEGCITSVAAGHHAFPCDGITYDVEVSAACAAGGCGLIFDVHGATMDADEEDLQTNLRALGAAAGYVVVQPTAPSGVIGPSWDPPRDDAKVFAFLEAAMRAYTIDPDRVHFTGFSQGGFMSWRMLCDHAEVFASVAPAAGCSGSLFRACSFAGAERPSVEVPVLYMHGTEDRIVNASCASPQRDAVVAGWSMSTDATVSMDGDHTWTRYRSAAGTHFEYVEHGYEAYSNIVRGHCVPGSPDIGTNRFSTDGYGCVGPTALDWGEAVLAFFVAHPRGD